MKKERIGNNISIIYRYSQVFFNSSLKNYNLGSGQYIFLLNLLKNEGINQEKLTEIVQIDKANTARAINKLVEEGYVTKVVNEEDRRAYKLYTTEKAEEIKSTLNSILDSWNNILLEGLSQSEKDQLTLLLNKIGKNVSNYFKKD